MSSQLLTNSLGLSCGKRGWRVEGGVTLVVLNQRQSTGKGKTSTFKTGAAKSISFCQKLLDCATVSLRNSSVTVQVLSLLYVCLTMTIIKMCLQLRCDL